LPEEKEVAKVGKLWKNDSFHDTYESADILRKKLLSIWSDNENHKGMQVKVKRMHSKNQFVVKTRLHPDHEPVKKEKKKNVKRNKKNKRNNVDGKFDPQRSS
jgi:hypothetical protein